MRGGSPFIKVYMDTCIQKYTFILISLLPFAIMQYTVSASKAIAESKCTAIHSRCKQDPLSSPPCLYTRISHSIVVGSKVRGWGSNDAEHSLKETTDSIREFLSVPLVCCCCCVLNIPRRY
jgi:ATP-dependent helicase YprA (DUF1998 family)